MTTQTLIRWLVIRNGHETRLVTNRPSLAGNEVAVKITVDVPQPPRIIAEVKVTLPEPPPVEAEATTIEYGEAK